jgi:lipoate---protein ligase
VTALRLLDTSYPSPAENLACDEALLEELEAGAGEPTLRFWESSAHFVVLGYSNAIATEVNRPECDRRGIPILRRSSGGGTVLQGPGCLNYNLTLPITEETPSITDTNCFVMSRNRDALREALGRDVEIKGHTDLAIGGVKFSGNAQRRKSKALMFHGCFLLNLDLEAMSAALSHPSKEPDYRGGRAHRHFVTNLGVNDEVVKAALREAWSAADTRSAPSIEQLVSDRYANRAWNEKF